VLFALNPHLHFVPASNTKLTVTAVALGELGPDWRYQTPLYAVLAPGADSIAQALVLVGRGDPTLSERFHDSDFAVADSLADSVALAGLRRVDGPLIMDASYFEDLLYHPGWNAGSRGAYYAAPVSAIGVAEGAVPFVVMPGPTPGDPAELHGLGPEGAVVFVDSILTDTVGARRDLDYERAFDSDTIRIHGSIPLDAEVDTSWVAVTDPAEYMGLGLARALSEAGIEAGAPVVVTDTADRRRLPVAPDADCGTRTCVPIERCRAGGSPSDTPSAENACVTLSDPRAREVWPDTVPLQDGRIAVRVATWSSAPMSEIVAGILKPSQNWMAEMVLKTLGARLQGDGSWEGGVRAEYHYLFGAAGIDSTAIYLRDGSGLTAYNLVTPHAVTTLLAHAMDQPWGPVYRQAMAMPGEDGTLRRRLEGLEGRIAGKTGTIRHVNALSGYLIADDGRTLIFSVLTNGSGIGSSDVRAAIDRVVRAMTSIGDQP
jgi:D-alanyl-D-alanine carboxypeptidase/D-alanyl-D-alanine-endopeptidase (penicillin-binding protein 4)